MKVSYLTLLILQINSAIDSGKHDSITIDDIHKAIEKRSLLRYLNSQCSSEMDLSLHLRDDSDAFENFYEEAIYNIYGGYAGRESKKWGIRNKGLCLTLAWTNEIIQQIAGDTALKN
ncbi:hypothetical protein HA052_22115 [Chromobacterium haemolyticum]|uniref:Uncharacterized protein n=1 Tax=Chromobacterium fluminis TaxID=3044269 RepID=A0ABX0LL47_9NEIS|nr:hypothetical protein [Chromobacterium haemolyticum]NHR07892.1 hypothetical protein [Chromobacterium haemolyticum]